jgi:hypothetical protein
MIRVYTQDGQPLDATRERAQMRHLWGGSSEVIRDMTVKANGTGMLIDRTSGLYQINGILIEDDAILNGWVDLDAINNDNSIPRFYLAWVKFDPLVDQLPVYGVTPSTDPLTYADVLTNPDYLVLCSLFFNTGTTNATQGIYIRPQTRLTSTQLLDAALGGRALSCAGVRFEQSNVNEFRLRWGVMDLVEESLGRRYVIKGDPASPISINVGYGVTLTEELVFTEVGRALLCVRAPKPALPSNPPPLNVELFVVPFSNNGRLDSVLTRYVSNDDQYSLGDTSWPQRQERESLRVVGVLTNKSIRWVNGMVTLLGSTSYGERGDAHNTLAIGSAAYNTQAQPDPTTGVVNIDNVITNIAQLQNITLETAYNGPGGQGSGGEVFMQHDAIRLRLSPLAGANPWRTALSVVRVSGPNQGYVESAFEFQHSAETAQNRPNAIRSKEPVNILNQINSPVDIINEPCDLSYNANVVELTLTNPNAPGFTEFENYFALKPGVMLARFSNLPVGMTGDTQVFKVQIAKTPDRITIRTVGPAPTADLPSVDPNWFGPMFSTVSCLVSLFTVTMQLGNRNSYILGDFSVTGDMFADSSIRTDQFLGNSSDIANMLGVNLSITGEARLAEFAPGDPALHVTDSGALCKVPLLVDAVATAQTFMALNKDRYKYPLSYNFLRSACQSVLDMVGHQRDGAGNFSGTTAPVQGNLELGFTVPAKCLITRVRARLRIKDGANPYSVLVSLIRMTLGTGANGNEQAAAFTRTYNGTPGNELTITFETYTFQNPLGFMPVLAEEEDQWIVRFSGINVDVGGYVEAQFSTDQLRY